MVSAHRCLFKKRTDGALVRLTTQVMPGKTELDADHRLRAFMHEVVPALAAYLPSDQTLPIKSAPYRP